SITVIDASTIPRRFERTFSRRACACVYSAAIGSNLCRTPRSNGAGHPTCSRRSCSSGSDTRMSRARSTSSQVTEMCHTVWLGAAGRGTAFALLKCAKQRWGESLRAIAADTNPPYLVAASVLAQAFEQVPAVVDKQFAAHLTEALTRHRVDTYVPILDEEI